MKKSILSRRFLAFAVLALGILSCDLRDKGTNSSSEQYLTLAPRLVMANGAPVDSVDTVRIEVTFKVDSRDTTVVRSAAFSARTITVDRIPLGTAWSLTVKGLKKAVDGLHWPIWWEGTASGDGKSAGNVELATVTLVPLNRTPPSISGSGLPAQDTATLAYGTVRDTLHFHFPSTDTVYIGSALLPDTMKAAASYYTYSFAVSFAVPATVVVKIVDSAKNVALDTFKFSVGTKASDTSKTDTTTPGIALTVVSVDTQHVSAIVQAVVTGNGIDSVVSSFGSYRKSLTDSQWLDTLHGLNPGPNRVVDTVFSKGKKAVASVTISLPTNSTDKVPPTLSRQLPFSKTQNQDTVGWRTTNILLSWKISDSSGVRSAYLIQPSSDQSPPGGVDSIWSSFQPLQLGLNTFIVVAVDKPGNSDTDTVVVFRRAYTGSPVAVRQAGTKDTLLPSGTPTYTVSWVVTDSVGVSASKTSLTVNGTAMTAKHSANPSKDTVTATINVLDSTWVRFLAVDSSGNPAKDSVFLRLGQAPSVTRTNPNGPTDTVTSSTVPLAWTILPYRGGVGSVVLYDGGFLENAPKQGSNNSWTATANLNAGSNLLRVVAKDSAGDSTWDTLTVFYKADTTKPVITWTGGPKGVDAVQFGTPRYQTHWGVSSMHPPLVVKLDTVTLSPANFPLYYLNATLRISYRGYDTTFHLVATDKSGTTTDSLVLHVLPDRVPPTVTRSSSTQDTVVPWSVTALSPAWTVTDTFLDSVTINGTKVAGSAGTFSTPVKLVDKDSVWITIVATDTLGNMSSDSIKVRRLSPVTITGAGNSLSGSVTATLSASQPGAILSYSTDKASWHSYPANGGITVTSSEILYAKDSLGSVVLVDSAIFLYPPVIQLATGAYTGTQQVTIKDSGATIRYTLGTQTPVEIANSATLSVSTSTVLNAVAILGSVTSNNVARTYAFPPSVSPDSGTFTDKRSVSVTAAGADSVQVSRGNASWSTFTSPYIVTISGKYYFRSAINGIFSTNSSGTYNIIHDTTLNSVKVSGTGIPLYSGTVFVADSLPFGTTSVTVAAVPNDIAASVFINDSASGLVTLVNDTATVSITVTNGPSNLAYTLRLSAKRSGTFTDGRDGTSYNKVHIGSQTWMAQNLNWDGGDGSMGMCYGNSTDSCAKYGRLYDWATSLQVIGTYDSNQLSPTDPVRGVCPTGWHIPSRSELNTLYAYAGNNLLSLMSKSWSSTLGAGTDQYGMSMLPGGEFITGIYPQFQAAGYLGGAWSTGEAAIMPTGYTQPVYFDGYSLIVGSNFTQLANNYKSYSLSVRCISN